MILTLLPLVGCTPEEEAATPPPSVDAPFIDPWEPVDATWNQGAVEASMQTAIDTVIGLRAQPVFEAYDTAMSQASLFCPNMMYDLDGYSAWVDSCATDAGVQFSGYAFTESATVDLVSFDTIALSATVTGPDHALSGSGYWAESAFDDGTVRFWGTYLEGQVLWDGPGAVGWIADGLRPSIEIERSRYGEVPFTFIGMRGALGNIDAEMPTAEFIDIVMEELTCPEPVGTISVRDDEGHWYDVVFDGETCDGCGVAYHLGEEVGEACVSFDSWTSWEPTP